MNMCDEIFNLNPFKKYKLTDHNIHGKLEKPCNTHTNCL